MSGKELGDRRESIAIGESETLILAMAHKMKKTRGIRRIRTHVAKKEPRNIPTSF